MSKLFIFDFETGGENGIPQWKIPSDDPSQPHILSAAALVVDADTQKILQSVDLIVKPDGWEVTNELTEIHGISHEYAMDVGIPEYNVAEIMMVLSEGCTQVAYNCTFDRRIMRIALKRFFAEADVEAWHGSDYSCAMIESKKVMGGKQPKLVEAYKHFTGKELQDAHSAMADTLAAMEVWFAIQDIQGKKDDSAKHQAAAPAHAPEAPAVPGSAGEGF